MACFCHFQPAKNPEFLPEKWANTSIVIKLQQLHNPVVALPKACDYRVFRRRLPRRFKAF
jgi:hypothetical protein